MKEDTIWCVYVVKRKEKMVYRKREREDRSSRTAAPARVHIKSKGELDNYNSLRTYLVHSAQVWNSRWPNTAGGKYSGGTSRTLHSWITSCNWIPTSFFCQTELETFLPCSDRVTAIFSRNNCFETP